MMDCSQVRAIVDGWEHGAAGVSLSGEPISIEDSVRELMRHLDSCPACRRAYGRIAPLVARDLAAEAGNAADPVAVGGPVAAGGQGAAAGQGAAFALSDAVMRRLSPVKVRRFPAWAPAMPPAMPAIAAAAAIAIFMLGLGLGRVIGSRAPGSVVVTFLLDAPQARTVALAGTFTGWRTDGYALARRPRDGAWELRVPLRKGEVYVYNFVIDGETWIPDPRGDALVDDGFGGEGSLLTL